MKGVKKGRDQLFMAVLQRCLSYIEVSVKRESVLTCSLALYLQWKTDDQSGFWCN